MRTATRLAASRGALICGAFLAAVASLAPSSSRGEPVAVRHSEGLAHGFPLRVVTVTHQTINVSPVRTLNLNGPAINGTGQTPTGLLGWFFKATGHQY